MRQIISLCRVYAAQQWRLSMPSIVLRGIMRLVQGVHRITARHRFLGLAATSILLALASSGLAPWDAENSGTTSNLRAIHNTGLSVAWASGTNGAVIRSDDNGYLWQQCA